MTLSIADADPIHADVVELRRRIHRTPELGLALPETQARVLEALDGLGLEVHTGSSVSSVVADLHGDRDGPTVLLRADMDALPMPEDTGLEFASEIDGCMHACGHDAHTAMLVGAARLLAERRASLAGTVRFMFQPGEEGFHGAESMIGEGVLRDVRSAFALHISPNLP
jgi:amidohydrolase